MIAPVVRCKNQMIKDSAISVWGGDKMLENFKENGPEVLNVVTCTNRYEMEKYYTNNKAIDDEAAALGSDKDPSKISHVAYYNSLPFTPSGSCYR